MVYKGQFVNMGQCTVIVMATLLMQVPAVAADSWSYDDIGAAYVTLAQRTKEIFFQDFRFVSYTSLLDNVVVYRDANLNVSVTIEIDNINNQILVGSRDSLYRLGISELDLLEKENWMSQEEHFSKCLTQERIYCKNYVTGIKRMGNNVLVCGTNSYKPLCLFRDPKGLSMTVNNITIPALGIVIPSQKLAMTITSEQYIFAGFPLNELATYSTAIKYWITEGTTVEGIRALFKDSYWLKDPEFAAVIEVGDYVFFFFYETSTECSTCGEKSVSRIARVCKEDTGYRGSFATYVKARLNCSLPGVNRFYYDLLQSVHYVEESQVFYITFTASPVPGSAVCAYHLTDIQKVFDGPHLFRTTLNCDWIQVTSTYKKACEPLPLHMIRHADSFLYVQMRHEVQPINMGSPLVVSRHQVWRYIAVDTVNTKGGGSHTVLFLASKKGIHKLMVSPKGDSVCLIELISTSDSEEPVLDFKVAKAQKAFLVAMEGRIMKIPFDRCFRHKSKSACIAAQDPYCGWDHNNKLCTTRPEGQDDAWEQNIIQCPHLEFPVDGEWSRWSEWEMCPFVNKDIKLQHCYCRLRDCQHPRQAFDGHECIGANVQISRCNFAEGWSDWEQWSDCPANCNFGQRSRTRGCANTPESFGGESCPGESFQEEGCEKACAQSMSATGQNLPRVPLFATVLIICSLVNPL